MSASSSNVSVSSCFEAAALCVGGPSIDCTPVVVRTENLRSRASTAAPESGRDFPTPGAPLMTSALPAFLAPSRSDASSSTSSARPTSLPGSLEPIGVSGDTVFAGSRILQRAGGGRGMAGRYASRTITPVERANTALHLSARGCGAGREGLHDRRSIDAVLRSVAAV
jgi:hypothetical protein